MSVFAVILVDPQPHTIDHLKTTYSDHYELTPNVFLVSSPEMSKQVSQKIGIGPDGIEGAVFRLNHSYTGYTDRELWEWLSQSEQLA